TPWAWLPALAAMTLRARSASDRAARRFSAPRILNEPVYWRFSAFSSTSAPAIALSAAEGRSGVRRAPPPIVVRAARISAIVTPFISTLSYLIAEEGELERTADPRGEAR